jgi:hypothetical protein
VENEGPPDRLTTFGHKGMGWMGPMGVGKDFNAKAQRREGAKTRGERITTEKAQRISRGGLPRFTGRGGAEEANRREG